MNEQIKIIRDVRSFMMLVLVLIYSCSLQDKQQVDSGELLNEKTNVIVVITDDQGYGEIGAHGNKSIATPNLDKLHTQSVRLTDFHVSPTCSPTRAALLTGHYSNRTGVWHTIAGRSQIKKGEVTMADIFAENDYSTGIFGKWHMGDNYPFRPQDRGFQEVLIHGGGGVTQQPDYWGNDYFDDTYFHNGQPKKYQGYCTDVWFDNAMKFIEEEKVADDPFFCYISTNAPHGPFFIADDYRQKYEKDTSVVNPAFYGMIDNIDFNMGRLLTYLEESGLEKNTLLIFMSDNGTAGGAQLNSNQEVIKGYNAGMRGVKNSAYEGGHRVPCFIRWPNGGLNSGKEVNTLTAHIDILPTLIDVLQLKKDPSLKFDGHSLKNELNGVVELEGKRTLITDSQREETPQKWKKSSTMRGKWRLINGQELYNVKQDPGQQHDLALDYPELVSQLRSDYDQWWNDLLPSFNDMPQTILGSKQEPTTMLYVHDMHLDEDYNTTLPWNQYQIRAGEIKAMGWWAVNIAESGKYKMTVYRWPSYLQKPINAVVDGTSAVAHTNSNGYAEGSALDIRLASLQIGTYLENEPVSSDDIGIAFEVELEAGPNEIRAWFSDQSTDPFAVNYIEVQKL